jgi:zinc protease
MAPNKIGAIYFIPTPMLLDRTIAPDILPFQNIKIPVLSENVLKNGNKIYVINSGLQPIVKLEIIFEAGNKYEEKTGQSFFSTKMLAEGTSQFNSTEIAEKFASIGYFIEFNQGAERAVILLNGLTKHLEKAVSIVVNLLTDSIFPQKEFDNLKTVSKQSLSVNLEKTAFLASMAFKTNVFGSNHYIGKSMNEANIDHISQLDVIDFYEKNFKNKAFKIFVSGKIEAKEIDIIDKTLGSLKSELTENIDDSPAETNYEGQQIMIEKVGSLQSSIRIGRRIIDRSHPNYFPLKVCNTILGGYFGSRLMRNIREEKGYTYGISSSHLPIPNYAYLMIGTDVKREFTQNTIDEVYKEIAILQTELVGEEELEVVKNFIIGDFAGSLNTPFDIADKHKITIFEHLDPDFFNNYVKNIAAVTSMQIQETAKKYLGKENLIEIVVGGK